MAAIAMIRYLPGLAALALMTAACAANPPITSIYTADPAVLVDGGRLYLYTGRDEAEPGKEGYRMHEWRVYSTCDMRTWVDHGVPANVKTFTWAKSDAYAADIVKRNGKFYLYAPVKHAVVRGMAIGVAVADKPTGPFVDARGSALVTNDMTRETPNDWDDIDPAVFVDDDGQAYLYFGNKVLKYAKLKPNMTELDGPIHTVGLFNFEEAPYLHKRNGVYYLSYASGFPEVIAYATGNSPTGPWTYRGVIMEKNLVTRTIHQAFADFNGKSYAFYHNDVLPGGGDYRRSVALEEFAYGKGGEIPLIRQTANGPAANPGAACNNAVAQTAAPPAPVLAGYTADPSIRVFGDTYYLYPTSDKDKWQTTDFSVWSSKNLVDWKKERMVLDVTRDLKWGRVEAWAPDAIARDGRYYFYFSAERKIGVATADSPTGPFVDPLGAPLVTRTGKVTTNTIDPYPFIDDDGQAYLYFGNGSGHANVFKLKRDMVSLDGDPVEVPMPQFREGVVVFKRKGIYYFMWSIDDARSPNYRVGWGTATSPFGPVVGAAKNFIVLQKNGPAVGTAHHSVVNVPGTDRWYVAYHRHAIPDGNGYTRETLLARMEFDADGAIQPMDPMKAPFKPGDVGEPIVNGKGLPDR